MRICASYAPDIEREVVALLRINKACKASSLRGKRFVRTMHDQFKLFNGSKAHQVLVHPPLLATLRDFRVTFREGGGLGPMTCTMSFAAILYALEFLHEDAQLIHTGLSTLHSDFLTTKQSQTSKRTT